jgi:hypothetical protein
MSVNHRSAQVFGGDCGGAHVERRSLQTRLCCRPNRRQHLQLKRDVVANGVPFSKKSLICIN